LNAVSAQKGFVGLLHRVGLISSHITGSVIADFASTQSTGGPEARRLGGFRARGLSVT
jgi:hypothetical protein